MRIEVDHKAKVTSIWLTHAEQEDPAVKAQLDTLCANCKASKHTVAVFRSGKQNLYDQTSGLLCYNRRRMAQLTGRGM